MRNTHGPARRVLFPGLANKPLTSLQQAGGLTDATLILNQTTLQMMTLPSFQNLSDGNTNSATPESVAAGPIAKLCFRGFVNLPGYTPFKPSHR